jgi:starch phosphorylase
MQSSPPPDVPDGLAAVEDLALDLRWTWSHEADALWARLDPEAWEKTRNPWFLLQDISANQLRARTADPVFAAELQRVTQTGNAYLNAPGWFGSTSAAAGDRPAEDYTIRMAPACTGVSIPAELALILWQK